MGGVIEGREGADEARKPMLAGVIERGEQGGDLRGYRGNVDDVVRRSAGGGGRWRLAREKVRDCELSRADWMEEVDVYGGIARRIREVAGEGRGAGWVPERGEWLHERRESAMCCLRKENARKEEGGRGS